MHSCKHSKGLKDMHMEKERVKKTQKHYDYFLLFSYIVFLIFSSSRSHCESTEMNSWYNSYASLKYVWSSIGKSRKNTHWILLSMLVGCYLVFLCTWLRVLLLPIDFFFVPFCFVKANCYWTAIVSFYPFFFLALPQIFRWKIYQIFNKTEANNRHKLLIVFIVLKSFYQTCFFFVLRRISHSVHLKTCVDSMQWHILGAHRIQMTGTFHCFLKKI